MIYDKKDVAKFKKWLIDRGAEILACTNEWELIRFKANGNLGIVYQNRTQYVSKVTGEAQKAIHCYTHKEPYTCSEVGKRVRRHIVIKTLLERDGTDCFYCGKEMEDREETVEHIFSIGQGGRNHINNLALSHYSCNLLAANKCVVDKIKLRDELRANARRVREFK